MSMKTIKWSVGKKRNVLLQGIAEMMLDPHVMGFDQVERYVKAFPNEPDYNIAAHGCLRAYTEQVRQNVRAAGVWSESSMACLSDARLWEYYRCWVGEVARRIVEEGREAWQ